MKDIYSMKGLIIGISLLLIGVGVVQGLNINIPKNCITENQTFSLSDSWWNEDWHYRRKITIDYNLVNDDLVNFPVLISHISTDFIGHTQNDGDDFVFIDETNEFQYYHEIEYYESSTGELIAWVNIPNLSGSQDTVFWIYYGNTDCENQQNSEKVWDSYYQGVWHLKEDEYDLRHDSTINGYDGIPYDYDGNEATIGQIDGADDFDGDNDHIRTGISFDYEYRTVSFWFNTDNIPTSESDVILTQDADTLQYGSFKANIQSDGLYVKAGGEGSGEVFIFDIDIHSWYMVHLVRNGSIVEYYINGDLIGSGISGNKGSSTNPNENLVIAARRIYDNTFDGTLDEIRVSNAARSSEWISTSFNNQNDPESFSSFGGEQEYSYEIKSIDGGIGVKVAIENLGTVEVVDLIWEIRIEGGFLGLIYKTVKGRIDIISIDQSEIIQSGLFIGLGGIRITININNIETIVYGQHLVIFTSIN